MPLNIDWQQILLHLANFVLLAGGLTFLLYKPVKKFMDDRTAYYENLDREAREKLEDAERSKSEYEAQLAQVEEQIIEKRAQAAKETEKAAEAQLQEAEKKAKELVEKARKRSEEESHKLMAQTRQEITRLAVDAARKVLVSQEEAYDQFLEEAENGENKDEAHE